MGRSGRPVRAPKNTTKARHTPNPGHYYVLLCRQGPAQLGPQSQSFSRSYGSSLPTSLTYMCLTLQRLRTLETGCGYRVRCAPKLYTSDGSHSQRHALHTRKHTFSCVMPVSCNREEEEKRLTDTISLSLAALYVCWVLHMCIASLAWDTDSVYMHIHTRSDGVLVRIITHTHICVPRTPRPHFHGPAGTPRRTRQSWRSAASGHPIASETVCRDALMR